MRVMSSWLHSGSRLPAANRGKQFIHQLGRKARLIVANDFFKLAVTERIPATILGLDHTIGVEKKPVAWVDGHLANGVLGLWHHSKNEAVTLDALQFVSAPV